MTGVIHTAPPTTAPALISRRRERPRAAVTPELISSLT
jgi:hypothetical protein